MSAIYYYRDCESGKWIDYIYRDFGSAVWIKKTGVFNDPLDQNDKKTSQVKHPEQIRNWYDQRPLKI